MSTEKPRYSITLDEELFKEVEDFRFEHPLPDTQSGHRRTDPARSCRN